MLPLYVLKNIIIYRMKQLYSKKSSDFQEQPRKETVQYLINFSKSLSVVKTLSNLKIELNLN